MNPNGWYKIFDRNNIEFPRHWSGRLRTYDEAKKMMDILKFGEFAPYRMEEHNTKKKHMNTELNLPPKPEKEVRSKKTIQIEYLVYSDESTFIRLNAGDMTVVELLGIFQLTQSQIEEKFKKS